MAYLFFDRPPRIPTAARYGLAVGLVVLAAVITLFWQSLLAPMRFSLFFVAVIVSALYGGTWPALVAVLLSSLAAGMFLLAPAHAFAAGDPLEIIRLFLFIGISVAITAAIAARRDAVVRAGRLEQWLRNVVGGSGEAVVATDGKGRVVVMNEAAEELTGWMRVDAQGKQLDSVVRTAGAGASGSGGGEAAASEFVLLQRNGKERRVVGSGTTVRDDTGRVIGTLLIFRPRRGEG